MSSSLCLPSLPLDLSTDYDPLEVYLLQVELYLWATASSGVYLLQNRLIHSHSCFEMHMFQHDHLYGPQHLQRQTCSSMAFLTATLPSGMYLLCCGLIHSLMHSHWCLGAYLLQHGLIQQPQNGAFPNADLLFSHNPFRGIPAAKQIQPWSQMLQDVPALALVYP